MAVVVMKQFFSSWYLIIPGEFETVYMNCLPRMEKCLAG